MCMRLSSFLPGRMGQRTLMICGLVSVFSASVAHAQTAAPPAAAPAAAQAAPEPVDGLKITDADIAMIIYQVKPDKTADFEAVWAQAKQLYSTVDDADVKAIGTSFKIIKLAGTAADAPAQYWFYIDPVNHKASYDPTKLFFYIKPGFDPTTPGTQLMKREDADALYAKLSACLVGGPRLVKFSKIGG
jgi:hypothetical protein